MTKLGAQRRYLFLYLLAFGISGASAGIAVKVLKSSSKPKLEILTGTQGGEFARLGRALKTGPLRDWDVNLIPTDGSKDNVDRLVLEDSDRVVVAHVSALAYSNESDDHKKKLEAQVRGIATLFEEPTYLVCGVGACSTGGEDNLCGLAGKRIYAGTPHSGTRKVVEAIVRGNECIKDLDLHKFEHLSFRGAAVELARGSIDGAFFDIRNGAPLITKMKDVVFIDLTKALQRAGLPLFPCEVTLSAGQERETLCSRAYLLASKNLPDALVADLLSKLYAHSGTEIESFNLFPRKTSEKYTRQLERGDPSIGIHPGASAYYLDQWLVPERWSWTLALVCISVLVLAASLVSLLAERRRKLRRLKRIFISHGRAQVWKRLNDHLQSSLGLEPQEFSSECSAGKSAWSVLDSRLEDCGFAFLIMTAEDDMGNGKCRARQNVVHELGLFQGRLGAERAIVLLEEGCERLSNHDGILYIEFPKDKIEDAFKQVESVLERENVPLSRIRCARGRDQEALNV